MQQSLLFPNRSLAHVCVKLDGLELFIDAPYVAMARRSLVKLDGLSLLAFIVW